MNLQLAQSPQFSVTWHPTQQIGSVSNYSAIRNTHAPLALCSHPASANRLLLSSAYWETMLLPRQQVHPAVGCISLSTYCSKSNLPWFVVDNGGRAQEAGGYHQIYPWRNVLPSWTGRRDAGIEPENELENGLAWFPFTRHLPISGRVAVVAPEEFLWEKEASMIHSFIDR